MDSRINLDEAQRQTPASTTDDHVSGDGRVNFEELKLSSLASAMVWDINTQIARCVEICGKLLWAPESGQDNDLLSEAIYARTALRMSGFNTVFN